MLCAAGFFSAASAGADLLQDIHLEASPKFSWSGYYEDNINSARKGSDKIDDFSLRYRPALELSAHALEWQLESSCDLNIVEYVDETDWNYVDQDYEIIGTWDLTQRLICNGGLFYTVDSDPDEYFLDESDTGGAGGYLIRRYKNKTFGLTVGGTYQLAPRIFAMLTGMWSTFETGSTDDSDLYLLLMRYHYLVGPTIRLNLNGQYNRFEYVFNGSATNDDFFNDVILGDTFDLGFNSDYDMQTYELSGGIEKDFTPFTKLAGTIGWRYTENDSTIRQTDSETEELLITKDSGSGAGLVFTLDFDTRFGEYAFRLNMSQNVGNNPNTGASYEQLRIRVSGERQLTERFIATCQLQFHRERTDEGEEFIQDRDTERYFGNIALQYKYRHLGLTAGYRVTLTEDKN